MSRNIINRLDSTNMTVIILYPTFSSYIPLTAKRMIKHLVPKLKMFLYPFCEVKTLKGLAWIIKELHKNVEPFYYYHL